jgi:hypothetical protein
MVEVSGIKLLSTLNNKCHEEGPLNWKEIWTKNIDELPCGLAEELFKELLLLVQSVLTANNLTSTQIVSSLKILRLNKNFKKWELSTSVLQKVLATASVLTIKVQLNMTPPEKLSFWINCYNMLALHSIIESSFDDIDPLSSMFRRPNFFSKSCYLISGHIFSLDDIEHGILRRMKLHPISLTT